MELILHYSKKVLFLWRFRVSDITTKAIEFDRAQSPFLLPAKKSPLSLEKISLLNDNYSHKVCVKSNSE